MRNGALVHAVRVLSRLKDSQAQRCSSNSGPVAERFLTWLRQSVPGADKGVSGPSCKGPDGEVGASMAQGLWLMVELGVDDLSYHLPFPVVILVLEV